MLAKPNYRKLFISVMLN